MYAAAATLHLDQTPRLLPLEREQTPPTARGHSN